MPDFKPDLIAIIIGVAAVGLIPFAVVTLTSFLKISVVLFLVRNALGTQQTPPNLVLYAIAVVLTFYVTAPLFAVEYARLTEPGVDLGTATGLRSAAVAAAEPIRAFLQRFAAARERDFLLAATQRIWPPDAMRDVSTDDLIILIPAFVVSELTRAFETGFLLYLPFIAIDLIVSNVLMAMGMVMVSPLVISVPFKLFLFVVVSGWTRLLHGLVLSYAS
jgi:type III secretion protein R